MGPAGRAGQKSKRQAETGGGHPQEGSNLGPRGSYGFDWSLVRIEPTTEGWESNVGFNPTKGWESSVGFNPREGGEVRPRVVWTGLTLEMCVILIAKASRNIVHVETNTATHHHVEASRKGVVTKARARHHGRSLTNS